MSSHFKEIVVDRAHKKSYTNRRDKYIVEHFPC